MLFAALKFTLVLILAPMLIVLHSNALQEITLSFKSHGATDDAVLINSMFYICRTIHDSLDSLSAQG